jgi:hypothetical protein
MEYNVVLKNLVTVSYIYYRLKRPDSSVGIAASYGLGGRGVGVLSPGRGKILLLSTSSRPVLGSTSLISNGNRCLFPRGKAVGM